MDAEALSSLQPDHLRSLLPPYLSSFIVDPEASARNAARMAELVSGWDDATCRRVLDQLARLGTEQQLYLADPACRELARLWSRDVILDAELHGVEHLRDAMTAGPTVVLSNHLAYFDSTAIDAILVWEGHEDLANRLVSAAGPKVYETLFRRVASACLHTLPVPQSTTFSHTEPLSPRELARRAVASVRIGQQAVEDGMALLIYAEGSRSRTGRMGPFLKGVRRYLEIAEPLSVVPAALVGTHRLMPVGEERMHPSRAALRFGPPIVIGGDLDAREALAAAHEAIAALLPDEHRPEAGTPAVA